MFIYYNLYKISMVYYTVYRTYRVRPLKTNDTLNTIFLVFIFMKKSVYNYHNPKMKSSWYYIQYSL